MVLYTDFMSALIQRLLLVMSVLAAYFWLELPLLHPYSLQAFLAMIVAYFIAKRINNRQAKLWHLAPTKLTVEMPIVTFAILLLIGATGNITSPLYPLTYIHLFFLAFATDALTAILTTCLIMLFHFGLMPQMNNTDLSHLATLPLMLFLFLFAKDQYRQALTGKLVMNQDDAELTHAHQTQAYMEEFISTHVLDRVEAIKRLLEFPAQNQQPLKQHLTLLQIEAQRALQRVTQAQAEAQTRPQAQTQTEVQTQPVPPVQSPAATPPTEPPPSL
jgi:hypothetical protein